MKKSKISKQYAKTTSTLILAVLMVTSIFYVLLNTQITTVNAQTNGAIDYGDVMQYEWPRPSYNSAGTMFSPGPAPNSPDILWRIKDIGTITSYYPVAFNGMVFICNSTTAFAIDPFTGNIIWTAPKTGNIYKVDETHMLIGSNCYDIATGNLIWEGSTEFYLATLYTHVPLGGYIPEEKIYIGFYGGLTVWDLDDPDQPPTLLWTRPDIKDEGGIGTEFGGPPYGEGMLFGMGLGHIMAVNARTGETVWKVDMPLGLPFYTGGYYMGVYWQPDLSGNMWGFNATNGETMWVFNPKTEWNYWNSRGAAAYGNIYYYNGDRHVYAIDVLTGEVKWTHLAPGHLYPGGPVVADGKVYVNDGSQSYMDPNTGENNGREVACLNATTGELIWKLPVTLCEQYASNIMIAYGNLYLGVSSYPGHPSTQLQVNAVEFWCISGQPKDWSMYGADPEHSATNSGPYTLALRFKFQTGGIIISSPTIVDGVGYVGSLDGKIYAFDADTGNQIWNFTTNHKVYSTPAVVGGRLYTGADDGNVYCLDISTGTQVWKSPAGGIVDIAIGTTAAIRSSPTVVGNRVYVGSLDGNLYCFDASNGATVWKFAAGGDIRSTPAVDDIGVYFTANTPGNGTFYKLDASDGSVIWSTSIPYVRWGANIQASPCLGEGLVFTASTAGAYHALNVTTGEIVWTYTLADNTYGFINILGGPLYADGRIFGQSPNNFFFDCVNATTGELIWSTYVKREAYSPPSYAIGRVYVGTENRVVYVLDYETGEKLSFYELGYQHIWSGCTLYNSRLYVGNFDGNIYCFEEAAPQPPPTPSPEPTYPTADEIAQKVLDELPDNPTADEIAQEVINQLPVYPEGPTADEVAQKVVDALPEGPTADEVAQKVVDALPESPSGDEVAQKVVDALPDSPIVGDVAQEVTNQLPAYPETPAYLTIDVIVIVLVAISIIIGLYGILRKQK